MKLSEIREIAKKRTLTLLSKRNMGSHRKLRFLCKAHKKIVRISPTNLKSGKGCRYCGIERAKSKQTKDRKSIERLANNNQACLLSETPVSSKEFLRLSCKICSKSFRAKWPNLEKVKGGIACPNCREKRPLQTKDFDSLCKAFNLVCLKRVISKDGKNTRGKFHWKCKKCKKKFVRGALSMRRSPGCPDCKLPYLGEGICRLAFETMFRARFPITRLEWLKDPKNSEGRPRSLDGFNSKLNYGFEHQGSQHYLFVPGWHITTERLREQKRIDALRVKLCKRHGVKLAVIPDLINEERILSNCYLDGSKIRIPQAILSACKKAGMKLPANADRIDIDLSQLVRKSDVQKIAELQKYANARKFKILKPDYPFGSDTKIPAECVVCNFSWAITPNKVRQGRGCPKCAGNLRLSIEELKRIAKDRGHQIESNSLENSQQKIRITSNECDHSWTNKATSYKNGGENCPICKKSETSERAKAEIKNFVKAHKRLPQKSSRIKNEKRLYVLLCSYCSRSRKQHDIVFENWARSNGYGEKQHKWTEQECAQRAEKFKSRGEFQKHERKAYDSALNNGWLDEICKHMEPVWGRITFERCKKVAKLCRTRGEFLSEYPSEYDKAKRKGWLKELCSHMPKYSRQKKN